MLGGLYFRELSRTIKRVDDILCPSEEAKAAMAALSVRTADVTRACDPSVLELTADNLLATAESLCDLGLVTADTKLMLLRPLTS